MMNQLQILAVSTEWLLFSVPFWIMLLLCYPKPLTLLLPAINISVLSGLSSTLSVPRTHSRHFPPVVYPPRAPSFLAEEREDEIVRKRGDSGDVTQQWQDVTSDQYKLVQNTINTAETN